METPTPKMEDNTETTPAARWALQAEDTGRRPAKTDPFARRRLPNDEIGEAMGSLVRQLGDRYAGCTLDNYEIYADGQAAIIDRLRKFAKHMPTYLRGGRGLLILGRPGTGKDHVAAALLKIATSNHRLRTAWFDGGGLLDAVAESITAGRWSILRGKLHRPHILTISDPFPVRGDFTPSQLRRLRDLIDFRYRAGLSTWITTNVDRREDAVAALTSPVVDRLREGATTLFFDWRSYREQQKPTW